MNKQIFIILTLGIVVLILGVLVSLPNQVLQSIYLTNSLKNNLQAIENKIPTQAGKNVFLRQSNNLAKKVDPELVDLDSQIISCDTNVDGLSSFPHTIGGSCLAGATTLSSTKGLYLGGQCCGVLTDTKEYHKHLEALQKYKNIPDMVLNPYKTPIALAQKWINYDKATTLNPEEQSVYDKALSQSKEGPCCCQCWHYYVNKGIAKKLIKQDQYNSKQIADFWGVSDICGT